MAVDAPAASALAMSPEYCRPPSAITGTPWAVAGRDGFEDRGDLRCPHACDDAGGADRARSDTDLDRVGTGFDERSGSGAGGDVSADDCDAVTDLGLELRDHVQHPGGVGMRGVDDEHVDSGVGQRHRPRPGVVADTDGSTDQQPAVAVLGGVGVLFGLDEVLDRDQTGQLAVAVDDRQLLDLVATQQPECGVGRDAFAAR